MGVLLSICFKTKEEEARANPQYQAKRKKKAGQAPSKQLSISKQHLLGSGSDPNNQRQQPSYNSVSKPSSPNPGQAPERQSPHWGRPESPCGKDKDTPSQLFGGPPVSGGTHHREDREKRPPMTKTLSFKIGGKDNGQHPETCAKSGRKKHRKKN